MRLVATVLILGAVSAWPGLAWAENPAPVPAETPASVPTDAASDLPFGAGYEARQRERQNREAGARSAQCTPADATREARPERPTRDRASVAKESRREVRQQRGQRPQHR